MPAIKPTAYQVQVKIFEAAGCRYVRTQGDHLVYSCPGAMRPVVIPKYQEVPAFIIKNNMKVIGMTRGELYHIKLTILSFRASEARHGIQYYQWFPGYRLSPVRRFE